MERHTCRPDVSPLKQMIMKRVKHLLLASCLLPTFLGAQGVASASFLEITPDAQSAGMAAQDWLSLTMEARLSFITLPPSLSRRM